MYLLLGTVHAVEGVDNTTLCNLIQQHNRYWTSISEFGTSSIFIGENAEYHQPDTMSFCVLQLLEEKVLAMLKGFFKTEDSDLGQTMI